MHRIPEIGKHGATIVMNNIMDCSESILYFHASSVRLEGRDFFEAFVMEARALGGGPSNKLPQAGVGRFISAPRTTMFLNCRDRQNSAVVNAPSPVRMNNLTFTWEAPFTDVGDIFFM